MTKQDLLGIGAAMVLLLVFLLPLRDGFTDDGFIHVQYAHNLITRGEYSFNPGEVSFGTTSPLWVMELAAIGRFFENKEALIAISRVLSWLAGFLCMVVLYRLTQTLGASRLVATLSALTFAADAWFARWTALSMESSSAALTVLLVAWASVRAFEDRRSAIFTGLFIALAALVRPEVYLALPVLALALVTLYRRADTRCVVLAFAMSAALLVPWLLFAKLYIGSFLPNTAGAKSGGLIMNPLVLLGKFGPVVKIIGSTQGLLVLCGLLSLAVMWGRSVLLSPRARFMSLWVVALPVVYVLFDIQILSRYLLLVSPVICALAWAAIGQLVSRDGAKRPVGKAVMTGLAAASIAISGIFYAWVVVPPSQVFTRDLTHNMKSIALYLNENTKPDAVVAAADIGYLAFYSQRRVLDLGGLVEPRTGVLRSQFDYEEILKRGLYLDVEGYPHVDYFIDRDLTPDRFDDATINGHHFTRIYATTVGNLGIRMPGPYHYVLYRVERVE